MKITNGVCFKLIKCKTFLTYFQNITVYTNAKKDLEIGSNKSEIVNWSNKFFML